MTVGAHCHPWVVGTRGHCGDSGSRRSPSLVEGDGGDRRAQQKDPHDCSRRAWDQ